MLSIDCARCHRMLRVSSQRLGQSLRCPGCRSLIDLSSVGKARPSSRPRPASAFSEALSATPALRLLRRPGPLWYGGSLSALVLLVCVAAVTMLFAKRPAGPAQTAYLASSEPPYGSAMRGPVQRAEYQPPGLPPLEGEPTLMMPVGPPTSLPSIVNLDVVEDQPHLQHAARIGEALALTSGRSLEVSAGRDGAPGMVLAAASDRTLRGYGLPDFRPRGRWSLQHPAYNLALDEQKGLLYAACSQPEMLLLGPLGERRVARGELAIYDVSDLLAGRVPSETTLKPVWSLPLEAHVLGMQLDRRGEHLFLVASSVRDSYLARFNTRERRVDAWQPTPTGAGTLHLARDEQTLYVTVHGRIMALDPVTLAVQHNMNISGLVQSLVATSDGRVYISDRAQGAVLIGLDMKRDTAFGHWRLPMRGWLSLALAPDEKALYLSSTAVAANRIWSIDLQGQTPDEPVVRAEAASDELGPLRGTSWFTADGRFLVNSAGRAFRRESQTALRP